MKKHHHYFGRRETKAVIISALAAATLCQLTSCAESNEPSELPTSYTSTYAYVTDTTAPLQTTPAEVDPVLPEPTMQTTASESTAPTETEPLPEQTTSYRTEVSETYEEIPFRTVYERTTLYYEGDEVLKRKGETGQKKIVVTTVYENGVAVDTVKEEIVVKEPTEQIVLIGTKGELGYNTTTVKENAVPHGTEEQKDPSRYDDERTVIRQGSDGYTESTYRITYKRGMEISRERISYTVIPPVNEIVSVGTRPAWTQKTVTEREDAIPYQTEYRYDGTLPEGTRIVERAGEDGYTAVTYTLRYYRGELSEKKEVSRKVYEPRNAVVVIGTKKVQESFVRPYLDKGYTITQDYGGSHYAMDIAVWYGDPILAVKSGTVIYAYDEGYFSKNDANWTYGTFVVIEHEGGVRSIYAHLKSRTVRAGDKVTGGQVIGYSGNTGRVNPAPTASNPLAGTHLHFEIRVKQNGVYVKTDPKKYIDF